MHRLYFIIIPVLLLLVACGGDTPDKKPVKKVKKATKEVAAAKSGLNGKKLYMTHCSVCHMPNGLGMKGAFPPLANTDWTNGPAEVMIDIVLNGFNEEIEINGDKYVTPMAALPHIKDDELAAILTYVRSSFGNESSAVTADEVAEVRARGK